MRSLKSERRDFFLSMEAIVCSTTRALDCLASTKKASSNSFMFLCFHFINPIEKKRSPSFKTTTASAQIYRRLKFSWEIECSAFSLNLFYMSSKRVYARNTFTIIMIIVVSLCMKLYEMINLDGDDDDDR